MKKEQEKVPPVKKAVLFGILLIIEITIAWFWVDKQNLDPSVTIGVLIVFPTVLIINLFLSAFSYLLKLPTTIPFLFLAIIVPFISSHLFLKEIDQDVAENNDLWIFSIQDTSFDISNSIEHDLFGITYSLSAGFSVGTHFGESKMINDTLYLFDDSTTMYIYEGQLFNFRSDSISISLQQVY